MSIFNRNKKDNKFPVTEKDNYLIELESSDGEKVTKNLYDLLKEDSPAVELVCYLGDIFYRGLHNVPKDIERGVYYYHKSADKGHAGAQYMLGLHYSDIDTKRMKYYLRLSALQNHGEAQYYLGKYYLHNLSNYQASEGKIMAFVQLFCRSHLQGIEEATEQLKELIEFDNGINDAVAFIIEDLKNGKKPYLGNNW